MSKNSFTGGANFSECRQYRYALWRCWHETGTNKQVMFIGLNPSTADETHNDATIRRCIHFAKDWGYSGVIVTNVFGFCSTNPSGLKGVSDPIGPGNDQTLRDRQNEVSLIVAAWGNHCPLEREQQVCHIIDQPIYCLGTTKSGRPRHPLYLPKNTKPTKFWSPH